MSEPRLRWYRSPSFMALVLVVLAAVSCSSLNIGGDPANLNQHQDMAVPPVDDLALEQDLAIAEDLAPPEDLETPPDLSSPWTESGCKGIFFMPALVDFDVNGTPNPSDVTVINMSGRPQFFRSAAIVGPDAVDFTTVDPNHSYPISLPDSLELTVSEGFYPSFSQKARLRTASLEFSVGGGCNIDIALRGTQ